MFTCAYQASDSVTQVKDTPSQLRCNPPLFSGGQQQGGPHIFQFNIVHWLCQGGGQGSLKRPIHTAKPSVSSLCLVICKHPFQSAVNYASCVEIFLPQSREGLTTRQLISLAACLEMFVRLAFSVAFYKVGIALQELGERACAVTAW